MLGKFISTGFKCNQVMVEVSPPFDYVKVREHAEFILEIILEIFL